MGKRRATTCARRSCGSPIATGNPGCGIARRANGKRADSVTERYDAAYLPLSARMAIVAGGIALRALASTWRYRVIGGESLERLRANNVPFIFSLWHGQLLPLIWHHHGERVAILVSEHRDGELIAMLTHQNCNAL